MSFPSQAPALPLHPRSILDVALSEYRSKTGQDLLSHPLTIELQSCDTVDGILAILKRQANTFEKRKDGNRLMNWISSSVQILQPISATLGEGVGLAFPPATVIFAGISILLAAAKDVNASYDVLLDLFGRIEDFFKRFKVYTQSFVNTELAEVLVKVVVKVLNILSIATKEIEQSRAKRFLKILVGRKDIEDGLGELEKLIQGEHHIATAQVLQDTSELRRAVQQMANKGGDEERKKIRKDTREWFSPPDPSINHNIAWKAYHPGSAAWLIGRSIFIEWVSTGTLLWVHGKPGSGKSILCSAIIQYIIALCEDGPASMAYFYFDFRDKEKQNVRNLVTSLLIQFSAFSDPCCDIVCRVYSAHGNGTRQPTDDVLTNCLKEMLTVVAEHPIYVVMDALDECPDHSGWPTAREEVLVVLKDLVGLHLPNLRVCVTSRPEVDIKSILNQLTIHTISLHDEREQQEGIADYVSTIVNSDRKMREWPDEDKELVIKVLSEKADGMFRWVVCQLETLRRSVHRNVRGILEKLPKTLDETYERVLKDINEDNREHARRLLHCLAVAIRPLRVEELAEILAFDFDDLQGGVPKFHAGRRWKDQEEAVLSTCSSLIAVVNNSGFRVVQFSHFSVKEFLTSDRLASSTGDVSRYHILPGPAHTILAQACLGCLLHSDDHIDKAGVKGSPLVEYAARHWVAHAQFEGVASRVKDGMVSLFDHDKLRFVAWLGIYNPDPSRSYFQQEPVTTNPLYYSALCGFHDLVKHLVTNHPQLVNATGGQFVSPLLAALYGGHTSVAELLLRHGGKVDVRGTHEETLLHVALREFSRCKKDAADAVSFLLKHGANVNSRRDDLCTPLHMATSSANLWVARMLLGHGADIDSRDDEGKTPLHTLFDDIYFNGDSSTNIQVGLARLLLEHGADVNAQDKNHDTPLSLAASYDDMHDVARVLLEHGAEPNVKDNNGKTPLHALLKSDFDSDGDALDFTCLLLEHGAKVNAQDEDHMTPLLLAMQKGASGIARILLEHDAEPNVKNNDGQTPLHLILQGGSYKHDASLIVRLLLERGADVNAQDKNHVTPLLLAAEHYYMDDTAKILLEHGAEPNVKNNKGKTPLHVLLEKSFFEDDAINDVLVVVRLLLEYGADVNAQDEDNTTPLHLASNHRRLEIAQIVLDRAYAEKDRRQALFHTTLGDVNAQNKNHTTDLHLACYFGMLETTRELLGHGVEANAENIRGESPLHLVSRGQYDTQDGVGVARLLLRRGANVNAQDQGCATPLHLASYYGRLDIARVLLHHGASVNTKTGLGQTPLHLVLEGNRSCQDGVGIVDLLSGHGAEVNAQDCFGETPLHLASNYGKLAIGQMLLTHGANARAENIRGQTPLHMLSLWPRGFEDSDEFCFAERLVDGGADVNARDTYHDTPLHMAYRQNRLDIARCLLERGADVGARNRNGETPSQLALQLTATE